MAEHHHHHHLESSSHGRAFAIGSGLNIAFVLIEAWYGWQTGSLALLADAAHNLSDVGGLLLAWLATAAARFRPNATHSYGWQRGSIMASFINAVVLMGAMGALAWEALQRLTTPTGIEGMTVIVVASVGMVVNAVTAWLFMHGSEHDLNIRGAFLHMAADALVSAGVVMAGLLYLWQGWTWLDPVVSLLIALIILFSTWSLFRRSLHLMFDGVPETVDLPLVSQSLAKLEGVRGVHDLHIWALSTTDNAITAHLVIDEGQDPSDLLHRAGHMLREEFGLRHATLQVETGDYAGSCHSWACGLGTDPLSGISRRVSAGAG